MICGLTSRLLDLTLGSSLRVVAAPNNALNKRGMEATACFWNVSNFSFSRLLIVPSDLRIEGVLGHKRV